MNTTTDSVRVVIFDQADHDYFLVLTEADDPDNWKLPGGKFNSITEGADTAATRELHEELQVKAAEVNLQKAGELVNDDGSSARYIYVAYVARSAVSPSEEIAKTQWTRQEHIPDSPNRGHIISAVKIAREVTRKG